MSDENHLNPSGDQEFVTSKLNVYTRLLDMATQATDGQAAKHPPEPMSNADREFLENALKEAANPYAGFVDPLEVVKQLLNQLRELADTPHDYEKLAPIVEQLIDQICDMDLAFDFCKLGGLQVIHLYLQAPSTSIGANSETDKSHALLVWLLAELAQQNPKVQELVTKEEEFGFLRHCLLTIVDTEASEEYKMKCVGAISSMVKGYLPGFVKFIRLHGHEHIRNAFNQAIDKEEIRLVTRLAIVVSNISRSFGDSRISKDVRLTELFKEMNEKLVELNSMQHNNNKYAEALDYMKDKENSQLEKVI
ncbi:hsp70-binding protein 1 [Ditylenchus destructor]|uniref:Hsp70-binding protein 1 n=1 Tax=Ditylenchus destructor TaxID=166010 RepID=A0AAD4N9J3_9BILA|nr:hsp70-binding protein 1 [Ditylenchus destructor]